MVDYDKQLQHWRRVYYSDLKINLQKRLGYEYLRKQVRRHNRKLHREVSAKGGIRRNAQAGHMVKGFCLNDTVLAKGQQWFILSRRKKRWFCVETSGWY